MDRKVAKELLHLRDWLDWAGEIVSRGEDAYAADGLLQEAGDSLMMKLGEAAGRLARANVEPPPGVAWADAIANRNWLIHQYDEIDRRLTWVTLSRDLTAWRIAPAGASAEAATPTVPSAVALTEPALPGPNGRYRLRGATTRRHSRQILVARDRRVRDVSGVRDLAHAGSSWPLCICPWSWPWL